METVFTGPDAADTLMSLVALVLTLGFLPLLVMGFVLVLILLGRGRSRRDQAHEQEEAQWMQEMHVGLQRLSQRVEALETLLMEHAPRREEQDSGRPRRD